MQRCVLALSLLAGCGDNLADCGFAHGITSLRNIWPLQLALDDTYVYYSDYNNDGVGTHVVWRQARLGGQEIAIAARPPGHGFGGGMAVDETHLYWTAQIDPAGYAILTTPREGGGTLQLAALGNTCDARGVAVDATAVYAGTIRCNDLPAQVLRVLRDGTTSVIWSSMVADVEDLGAIDGHVYIATTMGLVEIVADVPMLVDGHPTHRLQVTPEQLLYSTDEGVFGRAHTGGLARRFYTFETAIGNPRAFALDEAGLYVSEPPRILFVSMPGTNAQELIANAGEGVEYLRARGRAAYWAALTLPGALALPNSYSGGVLRVTAPCD